ncbi:MAG: 4Fe-4S dicluster domain-containing protein [Coriobacteriales bacterium]|nr:4Fe-4S dicluster domain-containing protein [Coriobacteriales bacterium]
MGLFHLGKMTFTSNFKKPATRLYPYEQREPFERTKGHIVCDIEECIFCGACARACPTSALRVDKPDRTWAINPFDCIQCSSCVLVCPKKCLRMDNGRPAAATTKQVRLYHQHPYSQAEKEQIAKEEAERQAKIAAARKAAAEKKRKAAEEAAKKAAAGGEATGGEASAKGGE